MSLVNLTSFSFLSDLLVLLERESRLLLEVVVVVVVEVFVFLSLVLLSDALLVGGDTTIFSSAFVLKGCPFDVVFTLTEALLGAASILVFLLFDLSFVSLLFEACLLRSSLFLLLLLFSLLRKLFRRDSIFLLSLLYKLFFFCSTSDSLSLESSNEDISLKTSKALFSDSLSPDSLVVVSSRRDMVLVGGDNNKLSTMKLPFEFDIVQSMSSNNCMLPRGLIGFSVSSEPNGKSEELGSMFIKLLRS